MKKRRNKRDVPQTQVMTEQEAEAFAARLARVWTPVISFTVEPWVGQGIEAACAWHLNAQLNSTSTLDAYINGLGDSPFVRLDEQSADASRVDTIIWEDLDKVYISHDHAHLAARWLPFFRRGCWLSGCPIEASMHEKMEWIQGFSREELEAWNLKF